ncbi:MAG TPA: FkbM family methyltransferase [Methylobacter sp.]
MAYKKKVIYDFGANNGCDIPYYLMKSDVVVAVEANPILADDLKSRFHEQVASKKLVVENCVLTVEKGGEKRPFYIHKTSTGRSQFPRPPEAELGNFDEIFLDSKNVIDIINEHGEPFYIKIDLEGYDHIVLKNLFLNKIRPTFISAESHNIEIFALLLVLGEYKSFNLVHGPTVITKYKDCVVRKEDGSSAFYSFPRDSAGPFGGDIKGPWMIPNNFFAYLAFEKLGWKDIHATNLIDPDPEFRVDFGTYLGEALRARLLFILRTYTPGAYGALRKIWRFFYKHFVGL